MVDCFKFYKDVTHLYVFVSCCTDLTMQNEGWWASISVDVTVCVSNVYEYSRPFLSLFPVLGGYVLETGAHSAAHA